MKLLITNDDGFAAPGIQLLLSAASEFGEAVVVAPAKQKSGISHRITFEKPLNLLEKGKNQFAVDDGTPADCIRVALSIWDQEFDYVLSGVNDGANLGVDTYYSGTVAAAREANFFGLPSIAFSQYRANYAESNSYDFEKTRPLLIQLLEELLHPEPTENLLTNVNLPDRAASVDSDEIEWIKCDVDPSPIPAEFRKSKDGELVYCAEYSKRPRQSGMDTEICFGGNVSISIVGF